jgi:hypothetical protein
VPSLPDLLTYLMDQHGLSRDDLIPLLGTASRVSEVLTGKRELSMTNGAEAPGTVSYPRGPAHPATEVVRNRGVTVSHFDTAARSRKSPHANSNGDRRSSV